MNIAEIKKICVSEKYAFFQKLQNNTAHLDKRKASEFEWMKSAMATSNLFAEEESGASACRKLWRFLNFFISPTFEVNDVMVEFDTLTGVESRALLLEGGGLFEFFLNGFTDAATLSWRSPNIGARDNDTSSLSILEEFRFEYNSS